MENIDLSKASFDDVVFLDRNKTYGAYWLRKLYDRNIFMAMAIAIALFSLALATPVIIKYFSKEVVVPVVEETPEEVTIIDIPMEPNAPPPPPIEQPPPPQIKQMKFIALEPAPDDLVKEPPPPPNKDLEKQNISNQNKDGKDTVMQLPVLPVGPVGGGLGDDKEEFYMGMVSKEVSFPGGVQPYIAKNLSERAYSYIRDREIKGKVFVTFEIDKNGKVMKAFIPAGKELVDCKICNEEIVRIIQSMQGWQPAEANGNPVNRKITIPIIFK